jgi:hypothetical protein
MVGWGLGVSLGRAKGIQGPVNRTQHKEAEKSGEMIHPGKTSNSQGFKEASAERGDPVSALISTNVHL